MTQINGLIEQITKEYSKNEETKIFDKTKDAILKAAIKKIQDGEYKFKLKWFFEDKFPRVIFEVTDEDLKKYKSPLDLNGIFSRGWFGRYSDTIAVTGDMYNPMSKNPMGDALIENFTENLRFLGGNVELFLSQPKDNEPVKGKLKVTLLF